MVNDCRDMSTAPKDGIEITGYYSDYEDIIHWSEHREMCYPGEGWANYDNLPVDDPICWMPYEPEEKKSMKTIIITGERSRTYDYIQDGETYSCNVNNVVRLRVSESGTHYLDTAKGYKHIMAPGWKTIFIDADNWSM